MYEDRDTSHLFPLKFCGNRWLKNGPAIKRLKIFGYLKTYFLWLEENEKIPNNDDCFDRGLSIIMFAHRRGGGSIKL